MRKSPVKTLPPEYNLLKKLDIRELKTAIILNVFGIALLFISLGVFPWLARVIRPEVGDKALDLNIANVQEILIVLGEMAGGIILMLIVHEALHGIFFWLYTRSRPRFAFKIYYAYASAPEWFIPKREYLVTALAPLVGITVMCLGLISFCPIDWIGPLVWILILNTSGAVGDLWMALELLRAPEDTYGRDLGDSAELYSTSIRKM